MEFYFPEFSCLQSQSENEMEMYTLNRNAITQNCEHYKTVPVIWRIMSCIKIRSVPSYMQSFVTLIFLFQRHTVRVYYD